MTLATLAGSKVSVIDGNGATAIQFPSIETALSALVKNGWEVVGALDRYSVLFRNEEGDPVQQVSQLRSSARLQENIANRRALSRLSLDESQGTTVRLKDIAEDR